MQVSATDGPLKWRHRLPIPRNLPIPNTAAHVNTTNSFQYLLPSFEYPARLHTYTPYMHTVTHTCPPRPHTCPRRHHIHTYLHTPSDTQNMYITQLCTCFEYRTALCTCFEYRTTYMGFACGLCIKAHMQTYMGFACGLCMGPGAHGQIDLGCLHTTAKACVHNVTFELTSLGEGKAVGDEPQDAHPSHLQQLQGQRKWPTPTPYQCYLVHHYLFRV